MKQLLLCIFLIATINISFAQRGSREKVKALKIAHITKELNLSSQEAEKFWPVYNSFEESMRAFKQQERRAIRTIKDAKGPNNLTDEKATELVDLHIKAINKRAASRTELITKLKKILPIKKILKLIKAEMDFNHQLLRQLKDHPRGR